MVVFDSMLVFDNMSVFDNMLVFDNLAAPLRQGLVQHLAPQVPVGGALMARGAKMIVYDNMFVFNNMFVLRKHDNERT